MEILSLHGVSKSFGSIRVANELNLSVKRGEALGVIGPNGAGKTSMFNLITGGIGVDSGSITFEGKEISSLPPHIRCRAGIARSYQVPRPFFDMTVFENVLVGATFGGERDTKSAIESTVRVLDQTGLLNKANRLAGTLPLLDRKRLELARALATDPSLLLLDEIAGGLTEHEIRELIEMIHALRATGISIIWIEHIMHALMAVVDRIAVLDLGAVILEGSPRDVMSSDVVNEIYLGGGSEHDS
ncbi:ABC transporter ATP-binding protein [Burkholderia sp. Ac-20345]|uniref:ABC transporter ATP-binding protein n=1 Tax=Burkholderia sp. Ac-20345 TaxID=2703891 RepID=UPI00197B163C|nr:ABC transporter ATP-binding protein [Burkholderia sp. Ac-20345]MBN3779640.1 ABC transporter ATP-binding protein [Burkholderia sp. Ac-20345]